MRKVLLVEADYKNKYPPIGLMKLATYHKMLGDEVRFYKGTFKDFIIGEIKSELFTELYKLDKYEKWAKLENEITSFILTGRVNALKYILEQTRDDAENIFLKYREEYKTGIYIENNKWDRVCVTSLFTFYFDKTINTINEFKTICKDVEQVFVGGVLATVLPDEIKKATGIEPHIGLLNECGILDDNNIIIDDLQLDYSILDDIEYIYPENNGFYGYMTRGCINKCKFCLVPTIEPKYENYKELKTQIECARAKYGDKSKLLLLDNNVLASSDFDRIIDNIVELGFGKNSKFIEDNIFSLYINKIDNKEEERINIKGLFKFLINYSENLSKDAKEEYLYLLEKYEINSIYSFDYEKITDSKEELSIFFQERQKRKRMRGRTVDFNQGLEAKLLTDERMKKLSEIAIKPLRIAFDHWGIRDTYEKAIRLADKYSVYNMSNYILYNYNDEPKELYYRLQLNIDLCEELNVNIYSFPMKYHPIIDKEYFNNRKYVGKHWNKKFIRAIQAILNSTKGKVGKGKSFFEEAFGKDLEEFYKILYMPEAFIIYRNDCKKLGLTDKWYKVFSSLNEEEKDFVMPIIENNDFTDVDFYNEKVSKLFMFYKINREDIEMKKS